VSKEVLTRRHTHSQDSDVTTVQGRRMQAPGEGEWCTLDHPVVELEQDL
jgi:hypothetical protein